jgi:uncharacterized protein
MFESSLTIQNPFGVSVFGSALLRVSPDLAAITATVARLEQTSSEAFSKAKEGARAVTEFLRRAGVDEFGMSRISLSQELRFTGGERRFLGYNAKIGFTVVLKALDRIEEIVSGLIDGGANEINSIEFQTSRLKELRAQARRLAIDAAKEKAVIYATAANVSLGSIIHIQDVNPQVVLGPRKVHHGSGFRVQADHVIDGDSDKQTLDPGAIEVGAAVLVAFGLKS